MSTERPAFGDRIAWSYLATVLAAIAGGLLALVAYQIVNPLACPVLSEDAADQALTCSLGWGAVLMLTGFAAAFAASLVLLKLERPPTIWLTVVAGLLWLVVGLDGIGQWWWILLLVLLPAIAALASASWNASPKLRIAQILAPAALLAAAAATLAWQIVVG